MYNSTAFALHCILLYTGEDKRKYMTRSPEANCVYVNLQSRQRASSCLLFFMAHPFIIHHVNYKGGWVSGHANWWWDWKKREPHLTHQSIVMHQCSMGNEHALERCFFPLSFFKKSLCTKNTTPATPRQMMRVQKERDKGEWMMYRHFCIARTNIVSPPFFSL